MLGDYVNLLADRRYNPITGTGSAVETIPAGAWITGFTFTAGLTDATLVITLPDGVTVLDTITVRAGGEWDSKIHDKGRFASGTWAFSDTVDYVIETAVP